MKLLLADDHVLFREALIQFIIALRPDWTIITTSSFQDAYDELQSNNDYGLVLLDLRMPGMDGLYGLEKIRENFPEQKISMLSGVAEEHHVKEAMKLGAHAYFPKTLSGKILVKAIEMVVNSGQKFVPMDETGLKIMPAYFDDFSYLADAKNQEKQDNENIGLSKITKREKDVLHHLSSGLSNKDIADKLDLTIATVKLHVGNICKKLDVENRTQAAIIGYQNGLADDVNALASK